MVILTAPCTPNDISPHRAGKCVCLIQTGSGGIFRADIGESRSVGHVCRERQDRLSLAQVVLDLHSGVKRCFNRDTSTNSCCMHGVSNKTDRSRGGMILHLHLQKSFGMPPCLHVHPRPYTATFIRELMHVMLSRRFIRQPAPV